MTRYGSGDGGFFSTSANESTGAPGSNSAGNTDGSNSELLAGGSSPVGTGAPGSNSGQSFADSLSVTHTTQSADAVSYQEITSTGHTAPSYEPIAGTYPTDTGASSDNSLIGKISALRNENRKVTDLSPAQTDNLSEFLGGEGSQSNANVEAPGHTGSAVTEKP